MTSKDNELQDSARKLENLEEKLKALTSMSSERDATFKEVVANHSQKEKSLQREMEELRGQLDQVLVKLRNAVLIWDFVNTFKKDQQESFGSYRTLTSDKTHYDKDTVFCGKSVCLKWQLTNEMLLIEDIQFQVFYREV